ncbi:MAG: phosphate signaling complex protein PhoU [Rikenellaceae bacterium]
MIHTEQEIINLKQLIAEMWQLVDSQVKKSKTALLENDKECAHEIIYREKSVNSYELLMDRECENFIALFNPVAVDLRFVLALIKINNNLERIGDFAEGIARFVVSKQYKDIPQELIAELQLDTMFDEVINILDITKRALLKEDTKIAAKVFLADDSIDDINNNAAKVLAKYVATSPEMGESALLLYACIRRLERIGDRCNNIAEDIIFYIDAKEMRHDSK